MCNCVEERMSKNLVKMAGHKRERKWMDETDNKRRLVNRKIRMIFYRKRNKDNEIVELNSGILKENWKIRFGRIKSIPFHMTNEISAGSALVRLSNGNSRWWRKINIPSPGKKEMYEKSRSISCEGLLLEGKSVSSKGRKSEESFWAHISSHSTAHLQSKVAMLRHLASSA